MGNQLKAEMAAKGKALKDEHTNRLEELKKSHAEAEALTSEREKIKLEAEALENDALEVYKIAQENERRERMEKDAQENKQEAEEIFRKYDSDNNGVIDLAEIQTRIAFDKNRDGEVSLEEANYFLSEHETVDFEVFVTLCWPKIKPYLMLDSGLFKPPATVDEVQPLVDEAEQTIPNHEEDIENTEQEEEGTEEEEYEEEETGEGEVLLLNKIDSINKFINFLFVFL